MTANRKLAQFDLFFFFAFISNQCGANPETAILLLGDEVNPPVKLKLFKCGNCLNLLDLISIGHLPVQANQGLAASER